MVVFLSVFQRFIRLVAHMFPTGTIRSIPRGTVFVNGFREFCEYLFAHSTVLPVFPCVHSSIFGAFSAEHPITPGIFMHNRRAYTFPLLPGKKIFRKGRKISAGMVQ